MSTSNLGFTNFEGLTLFYSKQNTVLVFKLFIIWLWGKSSPHAVIANNEKCMMSVQKFNKNEYE